MDILLTEIQKIDWIILEYIQKLKSPFMDYTMTAITALGNGGILCIILAIALICFKKTRKCGISVAIGLVIIMVLGNLILKPLVARPRPFMLDTGITLLISPPTDFSFPSGHTYSTFVAAIPILYYNKKWGIFALVTASLVGFSRLYLLVHFPTDVLFGAIMGIVVGILSVKILKKGTVKI